MTITINGTQKHFPNDLSLEALLAQQNLYPQNARGIAVAVNDKVVPKQKWESEKVKNGDRVEIITARQGG